MTIKVTINGVTVEQPYVAGKTNLQYAQAFRDAFSVALPGLAYSINADDKLVVDAPSGTQLNISASGAEMIPGVDVQLTNLGAADPLCIVIKNGVAQQTYRLSLNGQLFTYSTGNSDAYESYKTENIAESFRTQLEAAGYVVKRYGMVVTVRSATPGGPLNFDFSDTWNNQAMYAARGRVALSGDLPPRLDTDIVLAVGDVKNGGYYVKFTYRNPVSEQASSGSSGSGGGSGGGVIYMGQLFGPGSVTTVGHSSWSARESAGAGFYEETYRPGTRTTFAAATMPHVLIREANGSFTFKEAEWATRKVGDEISVPPPSFVGKRINDAFFFRNRFGFLTEDTIVFSKAGQFFDFWPGTAKEVLDSDPIDVQVSSTKVSVMRYAEPFNTSLLIFGDTSQWVVTAQGALTPKTVAALPSTDFATSRKVRPVSLGQNIYFAAERGSWSSVWEYYVVQDVSQNSAQEVTQHVPRYIPSGLRQLVGSTAENMLVGLSSGEASSLFIYKYLWSDREKIQESWSRWTFSGNVVNVAWMGSVLYLAMHYPGEGLFIEKLDMQDRNDDMLVDRRGHSNWQPYAMVYQLSPVYLQNNGMSVLGAKDKLKNLTVYYSDMQALLVSAGSPGRATVYRKFPDTSRDVSYRSSATAGQIRVSLGADARTAKIALVNISPGQCRIQAVEYEMTHNERMRQS